ncbi:protein MIS12 homolog [Colletes gigas]|uniref:protein MIS12 homolog n=1 Tax=Colletes gigas TaxID=935657 RepID=UPI001C9B4856|nr:protein MIS12 homolog [Colletes gigas]
MASSESRKRKLEEYEMQLFGFHSRAVYATMKNIVFDRIHGITNNMCDTIEKTYKLNSENVKILKLNQKKLQKAYCKGATSHLKSIENVVNKYIAVPSNVLLEEDKHQRIQYSTVEFENMKQSLEALQQRAKSATIFNSVLKEELEILEQLPISEDSVNEKCKTIESGLKCTDLDNKMVQLVENYEKLHNSIFGAITVTEKVKYNAIDNLKCKDLDINDL